MRIARVRQLLAEKIAGPVIRKSIVKRLEIGNIARISMIEISVWRREALARGLSIYETHVQHTDGSATSNGSAG